ncbi:hypothetical protein BGX26_012071, partial [Mortierella sp. AD094]
GFDEEIPIHEVISKDPLATVNILTQHACYYLGSTIEDLSTIPPANHSVHWANNSRQNFSLA